MSYRILIVDDNDINILLISKILQMEGYETCSARTGVQAIQMLQEAKPDMAILDVMMPGMDGYELCTRLRQPPINAGIPIVMLTAMTSETEIKKARQAGADDVWTKPFDPDLLREKIHRLLTSVDRSPGA